MNLEQEQPMPEKRSGQSVQSMVIADMAIRFEWRHTYRSARRDGFGRVAAMRKFVREVLMSWRLALGLHPKYDRHGREK